MGLDDSKEKWQDRVRVVNTIIKEHFSAICIATSPSKEDVMAIVNLLLSKADNASLLKHFFCWEIKRALFKMHPNKF